MVECDVFEFIVEGEFLKDMVGVFYWNGFNLMYLLFGNDYYWFLGEGMVYVICVEDGKVSYKNCWVCMD